MKIVIYSLLLGCSLQLLNCDSSSLIGYFNETQAEPGYLEMLFSSGRYEEFSKLLQIDDLNLVRPTEDKHSPEDPMFSNGLEMGDILLRPWQREQARQGINFNRYPYKKWDTSGIPYIILSESYSVENVVTIMSAITKFNSQVQNIQFREKEEEKDYVAFFNGNGCYSNLGKVGGQQAISLQGSGCLRQGTIMHEMLHTLGITHEHERPDRDKYIRILYENIPEDWHGNYAKASSEDFVALGKYDYYSIMHYPLKAPVTRKPAFEILLKNVTLSGIGQRSHMTDIDIEEVNELYS